MRPNTAMGFIMAGLSLTLRLPAKEGSRNVLVFWRELIGFGCSIIVFLLGGLTLIEYVFRWDLHIDQLLFAQTAAADSFGTIAPGRMAFSTALCFLISGLSLILLKVKAQKIQVLAQGLILIPALLGLVTLIGYAYGATALIGIVYQVATMALHTAVTFIMLSLGILLAVPNSSLVQTIFSDTFGGAIARRLLPSIIIVSLVLGWLCLQTQKTGLMETEFSVALLVLSNIIIFAVLVWLDARALNQIDKKRKQAELELFRAHEDLESRVSARTQELEVANALLQEEIVERKQAEVALRQTEQRLAWQSSHDILTGLVNRWEFERRLKLALSSAKTDNQQHSLCYLDLDRFKIVNDTCGHAAGDELLRQVTALLQKQVRATDTLARLGGDEFALLLNQCPLIQSLRIANVLRKSLQEFRFIWQDNTFTIGVSIGLVAINADTLDLSSILSAADMACYAAKNAGRNCVHVYQADDQALASGHGQMQWISRLTRALQSDAFCLYCQAIVPLTSAESKGEHYEILLRLQDETGKLIPPMAFIPAAERYNIMHLIDRWVISTFFARLDQHYQEAWQFFQTPSRANMYAINLSGASINDDSFTDFLYQQFSLYSIPPQLICFEITETVAITNLDKAGELIAKLKQLGCRFALDDFGRGMSSFAYLKNLPVDYLKIDGEFIKDIVNDSTDLALTQAINQVGHAMGIQTIAEFVEDDTILAKIGELGVDYAQGYGIAKPQPLQFQSSTLVLAQF
ncbi:EAL domain-containing protein [Aliterella atlantica]